MSSVAKYYYFISIADKGVKHPVILSLLVWCEAEFAADLDKSTEVIVAIGERETAADRMRPLGISSAVNPVLKFFYLVQSHIFLSLL